MRKIALISCLCLLLLAFQAVAQMQADEINPNDVALGKTTAASQDNDAHPAKYATDGRLATRWSSEYSDNQRLDIDLGSIHAIRGFVLHWEVAYGLAYRLEIWDGALWQPVFEETEGDGEIDNIQLAAPVNGRYVRFNGISRASEWGFSLWEFEVIGQPTSINIAALETLPSDFATPDAAAANQLPVRDGEVDAEVRGFNRVTLLDENARRYEKVEVIADIDADFNNPYNPADIRVDARFTTPSGKTIVIPGFYYQDFNAQNDRLSPTDNWSWRVRFTPTEVGEYHYQVLATTLKGTKRSALATFSVTDSDHHGFIRIDPRNPRYFAFDDGAPYFPIGEDMAWSTGNPLTDYAKWLDRLRAAGGNWIRVWMAPWGFSIEWLDTGLGNYDGRQRQAYELDRLMDLAAERDVYIMLSLLNHGQFSTTTDAEWDQNPYNAANSGPCEVITCFATDEEPIRLWNQRLRYIVARWGYSPNIMTWEWWNEINWSPLSAPSLLKPWIERSAALLASLDPYDHLVTHSGSIVSDTSIWNLDSLDFVQDHQYNMDDLPTTFSTVILAWLETYPNKPFLMGEFGSPTEIDTEGILVHQGLWGAPMSGAAGTGMTWWWDTYIDVNNLYSLFTGVANFFAGEDMAARQWTPTSAEFLEQTKARVYGLQVSDAALLWVVSRDYSSSRLQEAYNRTLRNALRDANRGTPTPTAPQPLSLEFPAVENAALVVSSLQPGNYRVEIWDTHAGTILEEMTIETTEGSLEINLPAFSSDLALKIKLI